MASEIRHSRRHCSVCQRSTRYSATRTRFWLNNINTLSRDSYTCRGIKIGALNMQFVHIFFHIWYYRRIAAENLIFNFSIGMLLHYPEKLRIQIFCRYTTIIPDIEENVNKLHIKCTDFNFSACVTVYDECIHVFFIKILSSSLNTMLIFDKHCSGVCCDEFPMPQIDRRSKQVNEQWRRKFYLQSVGPYGGKTRYIKHRHSVDMTRTVKQYFLKSKQDCKNFNSVLLWPLVSAYKLSR